MRHGGTNADRGVDRARSRVIWRWVDAGTSSFARDGVVGYPVTSMSVSGCGLCAGDPIALLRGSIDKNP